MAVPIGSMAGKVQGLISLNDTAAEIWKILEEDHTEEEVVELLPAAMTRTGNACPECKRVYRRTGTPGYTGKMSVRTVNAEEMRELMEREFPADAVLC